MFHYVIERIYFFIEYRYDQIVKSQYQFVRFFFNTNTNIKTAMHVELLQIYFSSCAITSNITHQSNAVLM